MSKFVGAEMMSKENLKVNKPKDDRARNWAIIAYPESAPENWLEILKSQCSKFSISPLHDSDMNADETQKKPHWHIVLIFENKKSYAQIKQISDNINGAPPQKIVSVQASLRYQCHLDNPEKAQYNISEVIAVGLNYEKEIMSDSEFNERLRAEIHTMIANENIVEYCDLIDKLFANSDLKEHYNYAFNHTIHYRAYLQSRRHKNESK